MFLVRKLARTSLTSRNTDLNNPYEETIFGSNRIKKQHKTMINMKQLYAQLNT